MKSFYSRTAIAWTAIIAMFIPPQLQAKEQASKKSRIDSDIVSILRLVINKEPKAELCQYDLKWNMNNYIGKIDLGIKWDFASELKNSHSSEHDFGKNIDRAIKIDKSYFCSESDLQSYAYKRIAEFESGSKQLMQVNRTLLSRPIFNKTRTRAIVIISHLALYGRARSHNGIARLPEGRTDDAMIYKKTGGRWRFVREYVLGTT
ncbi:hypothetical protein ACLBXO_28605 [Methylobacterium sp. C33D]